MRFASLKRIEVTTEIEGLARHRLDETSILLPAINHGEMMFPLAGQDYPTSSEALADSIKEALGRGSCVTAKREGGDD